MKWKFDIASLRRGDMLISLNVGKYFVHICWVFLLCAMVILCSLLIDRRLHEVVLGNAVLDRQQAEITLQEYELARLSRRTDVERTLGQMGSNVTEPRKPAITISQDGGKR